MTGRRIFGIETEYAVTAVDETGAARPCIDVAGALMHAIERAVPHLAGSPDAGIFLSNGSRVYVDTGGHPELAGPECLNPWEVVRFARAGDLLCVRAAEEVRRRNPSVSQVHVFATNVDYCGSGATWGAHESYAHRATPATLRRCLVPHLVSRVIYAGAGGFNPLSYGLEFTLSPRAHFLRRVVSDESTHDRGIVHTRNESLSCQGYHRQHLICGESLRSDLSLWLKVGTTALVVAMIEAGVGVDDVELLSPVDALLAVARDVRCRDRLSTRSGPMTAIEIQRRYLHHAREHLHSAFMPRWASVVCDRWNAALAALEPGPESMAATLDWAIKLAIYRDRVRKHGIEWDALPVWSLVVERIERARLKEQPRPQPALSSALVASANGPARSQVDRLTPYLRERGLCWSQLDAFLALRAELFEADLRWGELGAQGIFTGLDRAGVLDHRVRGVDRIEEAVEEPPAEGRAHVRGTVVRRLFNRRTRASCGWNHVADHERRSILDLSDPFIETEHWSQAVTTERVGAADARPPEDLFSTFWDLRRVFRRERSPAGRVRTPPPDRP